MRGCIDVAIDATKCRYRKVKKNHVQFLTAGKHYQTSIKRLLAMRGGSPRLQARLPAQRCSLLFQLWYLKMLSKSSKIETVQTVRKFIFGQGML